MGAKYSEQIVIIGAIVILALFLIPVLVFAVYVQKIPGAIDKANVEACRANLSELYKDLIQYKLRFRDWPKESGVKFFLSLWRVDPTVQDDTFAKRFTCPGIRHQLLTGIRGRRPSNWFDDWDAVDGTYTGYAGRDLETYPDIDKNPSAQALVADDNQFALDPTDPTPNHQFVTVVLFANGDIREYNLNNLRKDGILRPDEYLIPGPDCPVAELRTLRADEPRKKK